MQDVFQLPPRDLEPRGRTGAEPRIDLVELERDVELPRRVRLPEIPARGEAGQRADPRDERFAGQHVDLHLRRLAGLQVVAIDLVDLRAQLHPPGFDDVGDRPSGKRGVPLAVLRQDHPREKHVRDVAVLFHRNDAVHGGLEHEAVDLRVRTLDGEPRLVARFFLHRQRRLVRRRARLDVLLELLQPPLRFLEREHVLLRVDLADELIRRDVELRAPHVVPGRQQVDLILRRLHGAVRLGLDDLLLGLGEVRLRLFEHELLIGGIELDDDLVFLDRRARGQQRDDAEHAPRRGGHERRAPAGAQVARRVDRQLQRAVHDRRRRNLFARRGEGRHRDRERRANRERRDGGDRPRDAPPLHDGLRI